MNIVMVSLKRIFSGARSEKGFSLVEALVALVVMSAIGVVYLNADSTAYQAVRTANELATAQRAAQLTLDYHKRFDTNTLNNPEENGAYPTFHIEHTEATLDDFSGETYKLQKITVTVAVESTGRNLLTLEGYRIIQP